eukprot:IDg1254t1
MSERGSNEDGRAMCGRRFRRMLRCVERTGSSAACTEHINDFLACERAVFTAALHAKPPKAPKRALPAPQVSSAQPVPTEEAGEARGADAALADAAAFVSRAVAKQTEACSWLVDMATKQQTRERLRSFTERMLADMRKSAYAAHAVASRFLVDEGCDDPDCDACRGRGGNGDSGVPGDGVSDDGAPESGGEDGVRAEGRRRARREHCKAHTLGGIVDSEVTNLRNARPEPILTRRIRGGRADSCLPRADRIMRARGERTRRISVAGEVANEKAPVRIRSGVLGKSDAPTGVRKLLEKSVSWDASLSLSESKLTADMELISLESSSLMRYPSIDIEF